MASRNATAKRVLPRLARRTSIAPAVARSTVARTRPSAPRRSGQQRADFVYERLRDAIRARKLQPGDRVREIELAEWLNVSRTPVRDALRRLESAGLVTHAARQGLIVTELDPRQVLELYALREVLEGAAADLAARYASESEVHSLQDLVARHKAASDDAHQLAEINRQFHEVLYHAARNRYLIQALAGLRDSLALLRDTTYLVPGRPAQALGEHTKIVDAIRRQDPTAATEATRRHIRSAANARLSMVIGSEPSPVPRQAGSRATTRDELRPARSAAPSSPRA